MAVRPIRVFGDPVLKSPSAPIEQIDEGTKALVADLLDTVARNRSMALDNLINGIEKAKAMESLRLLQTCLERLNDMVLVTDAEPFESGGMKLAAGQ